MPHPVCCQQTSIQRFLVGTGFQSIVDGKNEEMSTTELSGGARIHYIFQAIFVKSLEVPVSLWMWNLLHVGMQYFLAARCRWQNDKLGQILFHREAFHPCYASRSWLDVFHLKELITCTTIQPCNVVCFLQDVDPCDDLSDEDIRTAIQNATGPKNVLFVPEVTLVKV
jgi:hypothetical protein